ncbi:MAG: NusG domain II-containing protein [Treponema sp.]|nr:NusG domain II-containing protein [Treponema sp.]
MADHLHLPIILRIPVKVITIITMKGKAFLKPLDIPVIVLSIILMAAIAVTAYSGKSSPSQVVIRSPEKTWVYPLDTDIIINIKGVIGETTVEIKNGRAAIISSPCEGQTCVTTGYLSKNGHWAACLPNMVFVLVEGSESEEGIDAASW